MMHDNDTSRDQANDAAQALQPTVDNFVTWSEIEQKIQQVAQPQTRQPTSSGNWRWGWAIVPILFGLFRLISSGTRHYDPPSYVPPPRQFDGIQMEQIVPETQQPEVNPPGLFEGALEKHGKPEDQREPAGPPK
jgi:hypothetical protein